MDLHIGDYISVDSSVCGGDPCFKGTRIMVHLILELLAAGETTDGILDGYPSLSKPHIQAALMYAAKTVEMGKIAAFIQ
jgi:uncharacterized protein (DUF433 family)